MWFHEIIGHVGPLRILKRALERGQIGHAYLFVGPEGVGKKTVALALAKGLFCEKGGGDALCHCAPCKKVEAGSHPDLCVIEPQSTQILVEQIRDIQERVAYRPIEGSWRVFIIDQAHALNPQSSNALLKVLEEPPKGNLFILIARSEAALLPTIISRCQKICFGPLSEEEVVSFLVKRKGLDERRAREVAWQSQGSIGRALELEDKPVDAWREEALHLLQGITHMSAWELVETARAWSGEKGNVILRLECLRGVIRELAQEIVVSSPKPVGQKVTAGKDGFSLEVLLWLWKRVGEAVEGVERNFNPQLVMEELFIEFRKNSSGAKGLRFEW